MRAIQMAPGLGVSGTIATHSADRFLSWFAGQGIPMIESHLKLGGLEYFHFSSLVSLADGRKVGSFGSSIDRKLAALKCAGEAIERQVMAAFFFPATSSFQKLYAIATAGGFRPQRSLQ